MVSVPVLESTTLEQTTEGKAVAGESLPAPLSLELTPDLFTPDIGDEQANYSQAARLPDLFKPGKKARPFTVTGKPMFEFENEEATVPSLTGGTVEVEVKLE